MYNDLFGLLDQRGSALYALLMRITLCEHTAEDLLQELFVKLSQHGAMSQVHNPYAYARRTAINLALDWRRARSHGDCSLTAVPEPPAEQPPPLARLVDAEEVERILNAASQLSEPMREVFVLRHIQQEDYADIADHLGKTPHQVRALCSKATRMIRRQLDAAPRREAEVEDDETTE